MLEFVTRSLFTFIIRSVPFKSLVYECAPIYVRLPIKRNPMTAVTTNTLPQRVFSSVQTCGLVDASQPLTMVFTRRPREDSFPVSRVLGGKCRRLSCFCKFNCYRSDTTSCQDYEEYEFVECLSEETQIIDLFKHCKLQPHKLSQYTLATCLSSCQLRILLSIR